MKLNWHWPTPNGKPPAALVSAALFILLTLWASAGLVEISLSGLLQAIPGVITFAQHLLTAPDWSYLPQLTQKLLETLEMAFLATAIAVAISLPLGILAARNASPFVWTFYAARQLLSFIRALPEMLWALVFVSAIGLGPLPGVLALSLVTVGFMGKFFAESIEVVGRKAVEGVKATGGTHLQTILFAMLPQALPDFIGSILYILDHNIRAATILGLVGAGGIGYDLVMSMRLFNYERIGMIVVAIYLLVTLLDRLSDILRKKVIGRTFDGS
jgi:phosphonate transport system permease protein